MSDPKKAIILSSGGLDSTTAMAIAKSQGFELYSLSFFYGQRHRFELVAAKKVAKKLGVVRHLVLNVDLNPIGGSALTDDIAVPKGHNETQMTAEIPVTYVPARNTIFLSHALAWAEVLAASDIFIGVNAVDYNGYPDCRPEFIHTFERLANLATKAAVCDQLAFRIHTPLIALSKAGIIHRGISLGVDYALTHSCYDPSKDGLACGACDSCLLRKRGFADANVADLTCYVP